MFFMELLKEGAEAVLYKKVLDGRVVVVKDRVPKEYRERQLDESIRKQRTRSEETMLRKAERIGIRVPGIISVEKNIIVMEFVDGKTMQTMLNKKSTSLCRQAGKIIGKMHSHNLIHGDLTTSNIIVSGKELVFVDFGLGFESNRAEDKAVDLLNLKKTFGATHSGIFENGWKMIIAGYLSAHPNMIVIEQMEKVEKRVRYKGAV